MAHETNQGARTSFGDMYQGLGPFPRILLSAVHRGWSHDTITPMADMQGLWVNVKVCVKTLGLTPLLYYC